MTFDGFSCKKVMRIHPFSGEPQVCGKLGALSEKRGFRTRSRIIEVPEIHPLPSHRPRGAACKSKKRGFCFCKGLCSRISRRADGCEILRIEDNPTALTSFETAEVFLCAASSKQHLRCSGLPKGNPQTPQYCFSFSPKISGVALRFSGCPLFMAHHYRSAAHSPFLQQAKFCQIELRCGKV